MNPVKPVSEGEDVVTLNFDINNDSNTMRLYNGEAPPYIDFEKPINNGKAQLIGTWTSGWASEDFPASEIHEYVFEFLADGSCTYREKQGSGFINHFGKEEQIVSDVYVAKGHWRLGRNNKVYIVFTTTENIEQTMPQRAEQSAVLL